MVRHPQFYVMYAMMLLAGVGGLMASARRPKPVADNFKIGATAVAIASLSLNPIGNGVRPHLPRGAGSLRSSGPRADHVHRFLPASSVSVECGHAGAAWRCLVRGFDGAFVFVTWGAVYALFPAALGDMFGARHAASNYSILYSSKGVAVILGGWLAALLFDSSGTRNSVFYCSSVVALLAALGAIGLRKMPSPRMHPQTATGSRHSYEAAPCG